MLADPWKSLAAGCLVAAVLLTVLLGAPLAEAGVAATYSTRLLHIGAAAVWLGLIWFVNFIQLPLLSAAAEPDRGPIVRLIVPRVARTFHAAAHLTLVTGAAMLLLPGGAPSLAGGGRAIALSLAIAGGVTMWAIVQFGIAPRVTRLTDPAAQPPEKTAAAAAIRTLARVNLVVAVPVTVLMIAAAHLY